MRMSISMLSFSNQATHVRIIIFIILLIICLLVSFISPGFTSENPPKGWQSKFVNIFSDDLEIIPSGNSGLLLGDNNSKYISGIESISGKRSILLEGYGSVQTNPDVIHLFPNTYYAFEFDYQIMDRGTDDVFFCAIFQPVGTTDDNLIIWPLNGFLIDEEISGTYSAGALTGNYSEYFLNIFMAESSSIKIDNIKIFRLDKMEISSQPPNWTNLDKANFPRLGNYFQGTTTWASGGGGSGSPPEKYTRSEIEKKLSFFDVIIGFWAGLQTRDPDFARRIKNRNPRALLLPYQIAWEVGPWPHDGPPGGATIDLNYDYLQGIQEDWIAKDTAGNIIQDTAFPGIDKMNMSEFCPVINGMSWLDYHMNFILNYIIQPGHWDGFFLDNLLGRTHPFIPNFNNPELFDYDLNLNGIRDETIAHTTEITRTTAIKMLTDIRKEVGDLEIIVGNTGANPQIFLSPYVNGYIFECWSEAWGYEGSEPSESAWRAAIDEYFHMLRNTVAPHIVVLEGCGDPSAVFDHTIVHPDATDDDLLKHQFIMGSALLGDGFYEYDLCEAGSPPYWFDEYSVNPNGVAVENSKYKGYLGQPLDAAQELKSESIVILEEKFDNGTIPNTISGDSGVSVSQDPNNIITGSGSLVIENPDHTRKLSISLNTISDKVILEKGKTYLLEFDWKILETIDVAIIVDIWGLDKGGHGISLNGMVAGDSGKVIFPITLTSGNDFSFAISLLDGGGKASFDNLIITEGGVGPWRRDFENGLVLVNPINRAYTFSLEELAGSFNRTGIKRILGTQAPSVNNGKAVNEPITLQPFSSVILLADFIISGTNDLDERDIDNDVDGYTENQGDCNDLDLTIYPLSADICNDGVDQDCDGSDAVCIYPAGTDSSGGDSSGGDSSGGDSSGGGDGGGCFISAIFN